MHNSIKPKVTLVGAGPGDPDLLTLKGVKALAEANVVLYDALANEEILDFAPINAVKIFVGKRKGCHAYSQDEINQLMVDNALTYGNLVRLKGGDPFIFGRGSEEIEFVDRMPAHMVAQAFEHGEEFARRHRQLARLQVQEEINQHRCVRPPSPGSGSPTTGPACGNPTLGQG